MQHSGANLFIGIFIGLLVAIWVFVCAQMRRAARTDRARCTWCDAAQDGPHKPNCPAEKPR
jgi:hypothetical protein